MLLSAELLNHQYYTPTPQRGWKIESPPWGGNQVTPINISLKTSPLVLSHRRGLFLPLILNMVLYVILCKNLWTVLLMIVVPDITWLGTALVNVTSGIARAYSDFQPRTSHSQFLNQSEWNKKIILFFRLRTITRHHVNWWHRKTICALLYRDCALQLVPAIPSRVHVLYSTIMYKVSQATKS